MQVRILDQSRQAQVGDLLVDGGGERHLLHGGSASSGPIFHSQPESGAWTEAEVAAGDRRYLSAATNSSGAPHFVFTTPGADGRRQLRHAAWNGSSWVVTTALTDVSINGPLLQFSAADVPHVVYDSGNPAGVERAYLSSGVWLTQTLPVSRPARGRAAAG